MKVSGLILLAVLALLAMPPATLLLAAHYRIQSTSFAGESALASIMGAIFTLGGLILALISFYTLARIDKVGRDTVESALDKVNTKIDERIQAFLEAYSFFRSAQEQWSRHRFEALNEIEDLVAEAEAMEPSLRGLNTWMGEVYFLSAQAAHLRDIRFNAQPGLMFPLALAATKGIQRLQTALDNDDPSMDATYALELAELYALAGESTHGVAHWLKRAKEAGTLPAMDAEIALTLLANCKTKADVVRLLDAYGCVPMTPQEVIKHCKGDEERRYRARFIVFADEPLKLQNPPFNPTVLTVRSVDGCSSATAQWEAREEPHLIAMSGGIPPMGDYDTPTGYQQPPGFQSMDTLLPELMATFTFIVPLD